jgi:hypothetical protein
VPNLPAAGFGMFGLFFTLRLFEGFISEKFKKVVCVFVVIALANTILSATPLVHLALIILQPLGVILGVLCILSGLIALKKHASGAKFYLVGFGMYMSSLSYLILSAQGLFKITDFTWYILVAGSSFEAVMLSFALGDKLKVSLEEKEKAKEEALAQATANALLVKEQNALLEEKVKERTVELREKNKEVMDSIEYASRIQRVLLTSERYIDKELKRMSKDSN